MAISVITDINELKGKTIKDVALYGSRLVLKVGTGKDFETDAYVCIKSYTYVDDRFGGMNESIVMDTDLTAILSVVKKKESEAANEHYNK